MANIIDTGKRVINLDHVVTVESEYNSEMGLSSVKAFRINLTTGDRLEITQNEITREDFVETLNSVIPFKDVIRKPVAPNA